MVVVLARQMVVNGITYPVGHRADTIGLREDRFRQLVNLSRIVDTEDESAARRIPEVLPTEPLFIADATGAIVGAKPAVPVPEPVQPTPESADLTTPAKDEADGKDIFGY